MRKMLLIHAGAPKTGTTTIQQFLLDNADQLRAAGCLYPCTGLQYNAHHPIAASFLDDDLGWVPRLDPAALCEALQLEIEQSGSKTVILSSEIFYYLPSPIELRNRFRQYETRVIVFLRRQDEWLESVYRQDLKVGEIDAGTEAFVRSRRHEADYQARIDIWASVFGRENVRLELFEPKATARPLQEQFLRSCGLEWRPNYRVSPRSNERLNQDSLHFLVNLPERPRYGSRYDRLMEILAEYSKERPDPQEHAFCFSPRQRIRILAAAKPGNDALAREYFGATRRGLFAGREPQPDDPWRRYGGLSTRKAAEIAWFIFTRLTDRP